MNMLKRFFRDESGLELSEYAVMLALIVVALFVAIGLLKTAIEGKFTQAATAITTGEVP